MTILINPAAYSVIQPTQSVKLEKFSSSQSESTTNESTEFEKKANNLMKKNLKSFGVPDDSSDQEQTKMMNEYMFQQVNKMTTANNVAVTKADSKLKASREEDEEVEK
jgi:hypothetical protein